MASLKCCRLTQQRIENAMSNVSNIVKSIQDIMRKDAGTYGDAQRLEQLGWMFFLKIFDDREKELELLRDHYKSPLPKHLRWTNWAPTPKASPARPCSTSSTTPCCRS
jgi:type I restriction-modification system DNA methylase subunit